MSDLTCVPEEGQSTAEQADVWSPHKDTVLTREDMIPPGALNIALGLLIIGLGWTLQYFASHHESYWAVLGFGVCFAFLFLPLYSLMHEAMHRTFHRTGWVNEVFGTLLSAMFPGPFAFLRSCHVGHHRRNRTDAELFDGYYPGDKVWSKRIQFYLTYLGVFWLMVPTATLILLVYPRVLLIRIIQDAPTSYMVNGIPKRWMRRIRLECAGTIALHAGLFWLLDLSLLPYLLLYALYGLCWSSQNYITHAFSPRDVLNGAFNLKANPVYALFLLNFNWHLAHHQHPSVPWIHLPRLNDATRDRPGYLYAFLRFWKGPQPVTEPSPPIAPMISRHSGID